MADIFYYLDSQSLLADDYFQLNLRLGNNGQKKLIYMSDLLNVCPLSEKKLLEDLIHEEVAFQRKKGCFNARDTHSFHNIRFPKTKLKLLMQLIEAKKLIFNQTFLDYKTLSKKEFKYCIQSKKGGLWEIMPTLIVEGKTYLYDQFDGIGRGPPHFIIIEDVIYFLNKEIKWNWVNFEPKEVNEREKEKFIEKIEDNETAPTFELLSLDSKNKIIPEPIVLLQDKRGIFANLYFKYGDIGCFKFETNSYKGDSNDAIRDRDYEKSISLDLEEIGYKKQSSYDSASYFCSPGILQETLKTLIEFGFKVEDLQRKRVVLPSRVSLDFQLQKESIHITGSVSYEEENQGVEWAILSFKQNKTFVSLGENCVGLLPIDWLKNEGKALINEVRIEKEGLFLQKEKYGLIEKSTNHTLKPSIKKLVEDTEVSIVSSSFFGELRQYQKEGVKWLLRLRKNKFSGILADEMGLGKTVQVIYFLSCISSANPHLIVVPSSLIFNWEKELQRFLPSKKLFIYHGKDRNRLLEEIQCDIILTSYGVLRREDLQLQGLQFDSVILDEASEIKNSKSKIFTLVCQLKTSFRLSITGTPIENHLSDLISHFKFIMPSLCFEEEVDPFSFKKQIAPFVLRRLKANVAKDLPEKIEQTVYLQMSEKQEKIYDYLLHSYKKGLLNKIDGESLKPKKIQIFEALLRLRQICTHPKVCKGLIDNDFDIEESVKFDQLVLDVDEIIDSGKKVLIYSQFVQVLHLVKEEFNKRHWHYTYLDGQTKNREKSVGLFQNDPNINIFLISLKAGGVGLNLTKADYVILLDPWWNMAIENQAIDRAHRIGRKGVVIAKRYVVSNTIEEKMMQLKANKLQLESVIDGNEAFDLSTADLDFLFS